MFPEKQTGTWRAFGSNSSIMIQAVQDNTTLQDRLDELEREFEELRHRVVGIKPVKKDWRAPTTGLAVFRLWG